MSQLSLSALASIWSAVLSITQNSHYFECFCVQAFFIGVLHVDYEKNINLIKLYCLTPLYQGLDIFKFTVVRSKIKVLVTY